MSILSWLQAWDTAIGAIGSVVLTFMLVVLYAKQQGLLKRELNREVRWKHTETLKRRIREWHGDMDNIGLPDDPVEQIQNGSNLPVVKSASVEPAPAVISFGGEEDDFRVIPETIEDDRYLQDLLENHAPDLRELKETIEDLNEEFVAAQEAFVDECPEGETIDADGYHLRPREYNPEWVFQRAVRIHRSLYETDKDREKDIAESQIQGTNSADPERAVFWYSPVSDGGRSTYEVEFDSGDLERTDRFEDEIEEELVRIHQEAIDDVHADGVYRHTVEAAKTLDEMQRAVEELRAKLVEHEGHPLYSEDCPHIEDAVL
ncbi:hypothetical protein [Haloferax sp. YSMS24]|uniref:hypothetical protein n=1 Tax=Haloferax sp. YSMS24 TaxID=3388425 RepID=UPI00398D0461